MGKESNNDIVDQKMEEKQDCFNTYKKITGIAGIYRNNNRVPLTTEQEMVIWDPEK